MKASSPFSNSSTVSAGVNTSKLNVGDSNTVVNIYRGVQRIEKYVLFTVSARTIMSQNLHSTLDEIDSPCNSHCTYLEFVVMVSVRNMGIDVLKDNWQEVRGNAVEMPRRMAV